MKKLLLILLILGSNAALANRYKTTTTDTACYFGVSQNDMNGMSESVWDNVIIGATNTNSLLIALHRRVIVTLDDDNGNEVVLRESITRGDEVLPGTRIGFYSRYFTSAADLTDKVELLVSSPQIKIEYEYCHKRKENKCKDKPSRNYSVKKTKEMTSKSMVALNITNEVLFEILRRGGVNVEEIKQKEQLADFGMFSFVADRNHNGRYWSIVKYYSDSIQRHFPVHINDGLSFHGKLYCTQIDDVKYH